MTTEQKELDVLQAHLNEALDTIRLELGVASLPALSSSALEPHPLDSPSFLPSPRLFEARRLALAVTGQLKNLLQHPTEKVIEQVWTTFDTVCLDIFVDQGVVDHMAQLSKGSAGVHVNELAKSVDLDPIKLTTILRQLSINGWVTEVKESIFALNRPALDLLGRRNGRLFFEGKSKLAVAGQFQNWVTHPKWKYSQSPVETAFQLTFKTDLPFFDWLNERPEIMGRYAEAVQAFGDRFSRGLITDYPWASLPASQTIIDCGGGQGAFSVALAKLCPSHKFIVQDMDDVIVRAAANIGTQLPGALESGRISVEAHDFFTAMPRRGDGYNYLFRHILHDWPKERVVTILTNIAHAAGPKSKVLIVENITPAHTDGDDSNNPVTLAQLTADSYQALTPPPFIPANFGAGGRTRQLLSTYLMGAFNAQERTLSEWTALIESSGLRVSRVFSLRSTLSVMECDVPNAKGEAF